MPKASLQVNSMSCCAPCARVSPMPTYIPTYVVAVRFADRSDDSEGPYPLWFRLGMP